MFGPMRCFFVRVSFFVGERGIVKVNFPLGALSALSASGVLGVLGVGWAPLKVEALAP